MIFEIVAANLFDGGTRRVADRIPADVVLHRAVHIHFHAHRDADIPTTGPEPMKRTSLVYRMQELGIRKPARAR